jgi:hypothetical protein
LRRITTILAAAALAVVIMSSTAVSPAFAAPKQTCDEKRYGYSLGNECQDSGSDTGDPQYRAASSEEEPQVFGHRCGEYEGEKVGARDIEGEYPYECPHYSKK